MSATRSRRWPWVFGVFSVLFLAAALLLRVLERIPVEEYKPPTAEAQRNDYLAAQRTLDALGIAWREIRGLPTELPASAAGVTLIWPYAHRSMPRHTGDAIEQFVRRGGHLVIEAPWWDSNDLLQRFGLEIQSDTYDDEDDDWEAEEGDWDTPSEEDAAVNPMAEPAPLAATQSSTKNAVQKKPVNETSSETADEEDCRCPVPAWQPLSEYSFGSGVFDRPQLSAKLNDDDWISSELPILGVISLTGTEDRPGIVHVAFEAGRVTAAVTFGPFQNDRIGEADHAEILLRVVNLPQPGSLVLFVRPQPGGLGDWLVEYAWRVLLVGFVLLVIALWSTMPRFGPVAVDPPPRRRRLLDHLAASGRLLWSGGEQGVLANAAASAALAVIHREYPHTRWLAAADMQAFLQRRFGFEASVAGLLLEASKVRHPASMTALARACAHIHSELAPHRASRATSPLYDS